MDPVLALERAYEQMAELVADIGPSQLAAATPCSHWDVRSLLNHAIGAGWMFTLVNQGQTVAEDAHAPVDADPAAELARVAPANVESWRSAGIDGDRAYPFGTFPAAAGLGINIGEVAVHSWDLARALGKEHVIDPEIAQPVLDAYRSFPMDPYRAHGAFGAEVPVAADAPAHARLLGYLGRRP